MSDEQQTRLVELPLDELLALKATLKALRRTVRSALGRVTALEEYLDASRRPSPQPQEARHEHEARRSA